MLGRLAAAAHRAGYISKETASKITRHAVFIKAHSAAHIGYFVLVFIEGHGLYAIAAGCMGLMTVILAVSGSGDHE